MELVPDLQEKVKKALNGNYSEPFAGMQRQPKNAKMGSMHVSKDIRQQVRRHLNCGTRHPLTIQTLRKPGLGASHAEIAKYIKMTEAAKKKRESDARNTQDDVGMRDVDEQQHPSPGTGQSEQQVR